MSQHLSNKTWFVITRDLVKNLTEDEARFVADAFTAKEIESVKLSDGTVIPRAGTIVCNADDYQAMEHRKRGDWQCKYNTWHDRKTASFECVCGRSH